MEKVYSDVSGKDNVKAFRSGSGTYARNLKNAYSVATSVSYKPILAQMPPLHGYAHQSDECLNIESFFEAVKIVMIMILEIDKIL